MKYDTQKLDSFRHSLMDLLCSNGAIWLLFLIWDTFFCSELLACAQSKKTPSAFHVTEGPLFSLFNSGISSDCVIFTEQSSRSKGKRGEKMAAEWRERKQPHWPASNGSVTWTIKSSSSYYVMHLLCDMTRRYFVTQLQCCPTEIHFIVCSRDENSRMNKSNYEACCCSYERRSKVVRIEIDVRQESTLSEIVSQQCRSERQKAGTRLKQCRALLNLLPQIANLSHPPPQSKFITNTSSNNNTDGFVPVRQQWAVNLNKNTTSKQKHNLPAGIHAVDHVTFQTA